MDNNSTPKPSRVKRLGAFLSNNPWVVIACVFSTLFSVPWAIISTITGIQAPGVTYFVNPARNKVAQAGTSSDLTILYKGQPISGSVTAASIALWNEGKKPVFKSDVLTPIQFRLPAQHKILEAKIVKSTRDVVDLHIDLTKRTEGIVEVDFKILEQYDGGVLQIIYEGDTQTPIMGYGTIVGQPSITQLSFSRNDKDPNQGYRTRPQNIKRFTNASLVVFGISLLITAIHLTSKALFRRRVISLGAHQNLSGISAAAASAVILALLTNIIVAIVKDAPTVPFDFN
jgi:hypothetical protein